MLQSPISPASNGGWSLLMMAPDMQVQVSFSSLQVSVQANELNDFVSVFQLYLVRLMVVLNELRL